MAITHQVLGEKLSLQQITSLRIEERRRLLSQFMPITVEDYQPAPT
jgi:hypothetical protein